MVIDKQLRLLLEASPGLAASPSLDTSPVQIRTLLAAAKANRVREPWLPTVVDLPILVAADRNILVRVYSPESNEPLPLVVYFHGGGWCIGDLDHSDRLCRITARDAGCVVVSVDYRLAPEHKFPAPLEDCIAATLWCAAYAGELAADSSRIAVMGDSAGANLAAAVTHALRDRDGPALAFQLLYYPFTDLRMLVPSITENAHAPRLTAAGVEWSVRNYLADDKDRLDPRASPALARDFHGLPPAMIQIAGLDPLRDDGAAYAERLRAAGVAVDCRCYDGLVHGYLHLVDQVDTAATALGAGIVALRNALYR